MSEREVMMKVLERFSLCSTCESVLSNGNTYTEAFLNCENGISVEFDTEGNVVNMEII